jgi:hypothetical protein
VRAGNACSLSALDFEKEIMNNTNQVSPSTNQVDANNPQPATPVQPTPATPAPTAATANTPAANPQTNPATAAAATNQPTQNQPTQPSQNQPHPVSKMFDSILKTMSGGPIYVNDPVTGQRREVQQTKGSMARAITAAALAGLFTPNQYRPGPFGGSVLDKGNTMAAAGQTGMALTQKRQDQAQQTLDQQNARRLFTLQNNAKLVQQAAAMAHQQHAVLADTVKTNQDKFMGPLSEFDAQRPAGDPSIFQAKGQTSDEVLAAGHKLTDNNVFIDGTTQKPNELGVIEDVPTYAVIRSTNADGSPITLKLPEEVTAELGKYSKPYEQAYKATGGNVLVPINNYMDAIHTYHTLNSVESFMNRVQKDVNPTGQRVSLATAYKNDPTGYWQAINAAEQAIAAGNGRPGEDTEDNVLTKIAAAPGGAKLLDLVGTPQQVEDWKNSLISKRKLAQEGGMGEKSPAPADTVTALRNNINALPPDDAARLMTDIPANGLMTMAQVEKLTGRIDETVKTNKEAAIKAGDPDELAKTAQRIVFENDPSSLDEILSARQNVREKAANVIHDTAAKAGLDTTMFTPAALKAKADTVKDYSGNKKGSTGSQIASFNAFLGHTAGAVDAEKRLEGKTLGLTRSPWVNTTMDTLGKQVTDDPDWKAYKTSLLPVQNEISNFLAAGYAVKAEDAALMQQAVDPHETPARITAALRQLAETADIRLSAIGQRYLDTVGTTYPKLLSTDSANTLKRLGINSRAIPLGTPLPRGWQNNQPQQLTDKNVARQFFQAAGGDKMKAQQLAKANGWEL